MIACVDITSSVNFKIVLGPAVVLLITCGLKTDISCQKVEAMLDGLDHISSTGSKTVKILERETRKTQGNSKGTSS